MNTHQSTYIRGDKHYGSHYGSGDQTDINLFGTNNTSSASDVPGFVKIFGVLAVIAFFIYVAS